MVSGFQHQATLLAVDRPVQTGLTVAGQGHAVFAYGLMAGSQTPAAWTIGYSGRFTALSPGDVTALASGADNRAGA